MTGLHHQPFARQHGAAIITALLVVMLAATIASWLLSQQSLALQRVERTSERAQIAAYAGTTTDWARSLLYENLRTQTNVHLKQEWAKGLQSTPVEGVIASGVLNDAQARFDLNNLVDDALKASEPDIKIFKQLLTNLKLDPSLADAIVDWIDSDDEIRSPGGAENAFYWSQPSPTRTAGRRLVMIEEISRVRGMTPAAMRALSPYITALPHSTTGRAKINLNTASQELLAAIFPEAATDTIADIIRNRSEMSFIDSTDFSFKKTFPQLPPQVIDQFTSVTSNYFLLSSALLGNGSQVRQTVLLELSAANPTAAPSKWPAIIWVKEN